MSVLRLRRFKYAALVLVAFVALLFMSGAILNLTLPLASANANINPAWTFQSANYGKNVSGSYPLGGVQRTYLADFIESKEVYTITSPTTHNPTFISIKEGDGSFKVVPSDGNGSAYIITRALTVNNQRGNKPPVTARQADWQFGFQDSDHVNLIGAYVYFNAPTFNEPCGLFCNDGLATWLGLTTNTGWFMQVTAAWGYVNCGQWDDYTPIFSVGWANGNNQHLSNCPSGKSTAGHEYLMQISWDNYVTGEWNFLVYDETAQSYVIYPDYISSITGTYVSSYRNLGVFLEGSSSNVNGPWLYSAGTQFTNLVYWDANNNYYHWVNTPYTYRTSGIPSNIGGGYIYHSNPSYVSEVGWSCTSNCLIL